MGQKLAQGESGKAREGPGRMETATHDEGDPC